MNMGMGGHAEAPVRTVIYPSVIYLIIGIPLFDLSVSHLSGDQRRAHLYVGNLSPRVTEYMLTEIFAVAGHVQHVKIIPDRNYQHGGLNYGFVEYMDMRAAETALQTLNGRKIFCTGSIYAEVIVMTAHRPGEDRQTLASHQS